MPGWWPLLMKLLIYAEWSLLLMVIQRQCQLTALSSIAYLTCLLSLPLLLEPTLYLQMLQQNHCPPSLYIRPKTNWLRSLSWDSMGDSSLHCCLCCSMDQEPSGRSRRICWPLFTFSSEYWLRQPCEDFPVTVTVSSIAPSNYPPKWTLGRHCSWPKSYY